VAVDDGPDLAPDLDLNIAAQALRSHLSLPYNGLAFSGLAQPCIAPAEAWDSATLPPAKPYEHCDVRCKRRHGEYALQMG